MPRNKDREPSDSRAAGGLGGILGGLNEFIDKLGELADTGREFRKTTEVQGGGPGREVKGVYGFSVKVGLGTDGVKVEPFGNIHRDKQSGHAVVQEHREPMVDLFEEADHLLIVAEMPGVNADDVRLDLKDDMLTIKAERRDKKYLKEVLLPGVFAREKMAVTCTNGVVEIRCGR
jgi:HSP20 family protein